MQIGTIGTGPIVSYIISQAIKTPGVHFSAVYSRDIGRAQELAARFGIGKTYDDLDAMLDDKDLDFIYIASPNSLHYQQAKAALQKGKNVICEKPFTSTLWQAQELRDLARSQKLFLFEAVTTIYLPNYRFVKESLPLLGDLRMVLLNYTQYSSRYDLLKAGETPNIFNTEFEGGALLDLNIYNIHFAAGLFGMPQDVRYFANRFNGDGADTSGVAVLDYGTFKCVCTAAKDAKGENGSQIQGEKGYILLPKGASVCPEVRVYGETEQQVNLQGDNLPWVYEFAEMQGIVEKKDYEACYEILEHSLMVVDIAQQARLSAGIRFQADDEKKTE